MEPRPRSHLDAAHPVPHGQEGALGRHVVHHQDPICLPEILLGDAPKPEPTQKQRHPQNLAVQQELMEWDCLSVSAGSLQGPVHDVSLRAGVYTQVTAFETAQAAMGKQESC